MALYRYKKPEPQPIDPVKLSVLHARLDAAEAAASERVKHVRLNPSFKQPITGPRGGRYYERRTSGGMLRRQYV